MMRLVAFSFAFFLASSAVMLGQTFGEITGEIRDASGAIVSGAVVSVTNQATSVSRTGNSNEAGAYTFPSLNPGVYDVKVTVPGFQLITRRGVELQVQQTARIDF